jgi:hypothetical protein
MVARQEIAALAQELQCGKSMGEGKIVPLRPGQENFFPGTMTAKLAMAKNNDIIEINFLNLLKLEP